MLSNDTIVIATLNIRSLPKHHAHLLSEEFSTKITILCLTETHSPDTSTNVTCALPGHAFLHKATPHGLAMSYNDTYQATELPCADHGDTLEILVSIFKRSSYPDILLVLIYRPPGPHQDFLQQLDTQLAILPLDIMSTIITGDFNMPHHNNLDDLLSKYGLTQSVTGPTHTHGGQLDLIFTNIDTDNPTVPVPVYFSDHFLVWIAMTDVHQ